MNPALCVLAVIAIFSVTPAIAKTATVADFFSNCANLPDAGGRTLTVDLANRTAGAYPSLAAALQAAKPGDTVALMTGDYGDLALSGINQNGFTTIAAGAGQTPKFTKIKIGGFNPASHWRLIGLTISSFRHVADKRAQQSLVMISNSDNIILEHNNLNSADGIIDWQAQTPAANPPDFVSSGISASQSSCISIVENHLHNLFNGIDFGGDQTGDHGKYFLVSGNNIDNFAGDGIDHYGSYVRIENNRITDGHDICNNQCVHNDGIQGWNYNNLPVYDSNIVIDGNVIIAQITPGLAMPVDALQGITIFNGAWDGVQIFNNMIAVNAWHGITVYGADNVSIVNNTLASTSLSRANWIAFLGRKDYPPEKLYNVVIRNNVAPALLKQRTPYPPGVEVDHNLFLKSADDFADAFIKFDPENFAYDLHPAKGSPVKGEGSPDGAPATDIEGHVRRTPIDVGAYAYSGK